MASDSCKFFKYLIKHVIIFDNNGFCDRFTTYLYKNKVVVFISFNLFIFQNIFFLNNDLLLIAILLVY